MFPKNKRSIIETIGRQAKSEGTNKAGCEKHNGSKKT